MDFHNKLIGKNLKKLINPETGALDLNDANLEACMTEAVSICNDLIGCTLVVRDKKYILANLELYYGGIGDAGHDWYRYRYPQVVNKSRAGLSGETIKHQELQGPAVYIGRFGNHQRMDIVIGPEGVPISVLIRNVLDSNLESLSKVWTGNTKIVLDKLGITHQDSGKIISDSGEFKLLDTQKDFLPDPTKHITRDKRFIGTKPEGFKGLWGQEKWNFTLSEQHIQELRRKRT